MTLLEWLKYETPRHKKNSLLKVLPFVEKHFDEISNARQQGYSWVQIKQAFKAIYPDELPSPLPIDKAFNKLRKENILHERQ